MPSVSSPVSPPLSGHASPSSGGGAGSTTLILDVLPSLALGAWSLNERLRVGYTGALFRIRRSSDNALLDIGYRPDNHVDEAAIAAHCGAGTGAVVTIYDQSSNGKDITQATANNQPQVYDGTAVVKVGSNVVATCGTPAATILARADACGLAVNPAFTYACMWNPQNTGNPVSATFGPDTANRNITFYYAAQKPAIDTFGAGIVFVAGVNAFHYDVWIHASGGNVGSSTCRQNGAAKGTQSTSNPTNNFNILNTAGQLGSYPAGVNPNTGTWSQAILFNTDLSGQQLAALESWLELRRAT